MYVSSKDAQAFYKVSSETLRRWSIDGKLDFIITPGGHRRYKLVPQNVNKVKLQSFIYARVSSKKQEDDLNRQIKFAQNKFPKYKVISDIASGINFKRKGFKTILEQVLKGNVKEIVVTHKDRLSRFGFDLFQFICKKNGTKITILNDRDSKDESNELTDDLMAIITLFTSRYKGKRKYNLL